MDRFGPYEILGPVGAGGMGEVYRARDTRLNRTVAIKILRPDLYTSPEMRMRFAHEARAAITLHHPHIVAVYEVGCEQGLPFICMEYVEGETLEIRIRRRPLGIAECLRCASEMAEAISAAHSAGLVHRDIKPANIIITPGQGIKILDFGLAKFDPPKDASESGVTRCVRR